MPALPKRPCRQPGCPALVTTGYCPAHAHASREARPSACKRGYGRRWQRYRRAYLAQHPICRRCLRAAAEHVDHVVPVSGPDDPRFWDSANHQGLCPSCHSEKTAREDGGFGHR